MRQKNFTKKRYDNTLNMNNNMAWTYVIKKWKSQLGANLHIFWSL